VVLAPPASGAATDCAPGAPERYGGPCYYGALPAFFDDFTYTDAALPASAPHSGSIFGTNAWALREDTAQSRGWYRFNRDDLPLAGTLSFDGSVLRMEVPAGLPAQRASRLPTITSGTVGRAGTFHWRVRFSDLWDGQRVRQAAWTHAGTTYVFDHAASGDTTRHTYWSELDFENENHFQGENRGGTFVPDFVARLSVGNHYATVGTRRGSRRAGRQGVVDWEDGRGKLARDGPGRGAAVEAPLVPSWAERWLHLLLHVDDEAETATYRMIAEDPDGALRAVAERAVTVGPDFYPIDPMHIALSLHWIQPEGALEQPLWLEADWAYYTPVVGLTDDEVLGQVALLRQRGLPRVSTTGRPVFVPFEAGAVPVRIEGPTEVRCGDAAAWTMRVGRLGRYHVTYRYRLLHADGVPGPWEDLPARTLALTPRSGQAGVELEATAQDLWAPNGPVTDSGGWQVPHPDNDAGTARHTARFDCGS
jgi:hypothetical protein